jgi:Salmonella virulence plasmid 65kDa B protein
MVSLRDAGGRGEDNAVAAQESGRNPRDTLQGIGETFALDLHTGPGNFTVPTALPPGQHGFRPYLSHVDSTADGHGLFGLGWRLSIPGAAGYRYRSGDAGFTRF